MFTLTFVMSFPHKYWAVTGLEVLLALPLDFINVEAESKAEMYSTCAADKILAFIWRRRWKNSLFWTCSGWYYDTHFFCPPPNTLLLPRTLWAAPCQPCHHPGALPRQRRGPGTGHAGWSSHWNGSGITLLGLLDYPFLVSVVPNPFIVCNNILAMLFTVKLWKMQ